jgi:hypothetical protein
MSDEIAVATPDALHTQMEFAKALASADLLPAAFKAKPANVLLAMELGKSLGIDTMTAINGVNVIAGKPSLGADLVAALVRRAGHTLRVKMVDERTAKAVIIRRDDPEFQFSSVWTMDRAKAAGLTGKDSWKNYPQNMLRKRAITEVARDACPEALAGIGYDPEELEHASPAAPVVDSSHLIAAATASAPVESVDTATGVIEAVVLDDDPEGEGQ